MKTALLGAALLLSACAQVTDVGYLPGPSHVSVTAAPTTTPGTLSVTIWADLGALLLPSTVKVQLLDGATVVRTLNAAQAAPVTPTEDAPFTTRYDLSVPLDTTREHVLTAQVAWTLHQTTHEITSAPLTVAAGSF